MGFGFIYHDHAFIRRICERMPHTIEILELNADKDIPRVGLRIFFPVALSPFAYICKNEVLQVTFISPFHASYCAFLDVLFIVCLEF